MTNLADKRVLRTKKSIRDAFIALLETRSISRITVKALAEEAGINRKTFYMYYSGIEELLEQIEQDLIEKYRPLLSTIDLTGGTFTPLNFFSEFNVIVSHDMKLYELLYRDGLIPHLLNQIRVIIIDTFMEQLPAVTGPEHYRLRLAAEYAATGILSMLSLWIATRECSLEDFTELAANLTLRGFLTLGQAET